jgi:hypothetical protein
MAIAQETLLYQYFSKYFLTTFAQTKFDDNDNIQVLMFA